jgi:uncharacterized protein
VYFLFLIGVGAIILQIMNTAFPNNYSVSRRQLILSGLAVCGYLATGGLVPAEADDVRLPKGYTRPGPVTDRGRAPGLQSRVVAENPNGEKTYALIFGKGDEILSGLTEFAEREKLTAGHFTAIGGLQGGLFGWFDHARKAFRNISINQQVEVISLIGDVGLVNGAPQIHAHAAVGLPDGQMRGGHVLEAVVKPTLELFFTSYPTTLNKKHEAGTNLTLFDLKA